jgi:hypothetical protein
MVEVVLVDLIVPCRPSDLVVLEVAGLMTMMSMLVGSPLRPPRRVVDILATLLVPLVLLVLL